MRHALTVINLFGGCVSSRHASLGVKLHDFFSNRRQDTAHGKMFNRIPIFSGVPSAFDVGIFEHIGLALRQVWVLRIGEPSAIVGRVRGLRQIRVLGVVQQRGIQVCSPVLRK